MQNLTALVTGGTKGIGKEISRSLVLAGCRVYINYSKDKQTADAAQKDLGPSSKAILADVSDQEQVNMMVESIIKDTGNIDILVNNAGIIRDGLMMLMPDANWHTVIDTNLNSVYYCSKAVLRGMIGRRWGRIINIISPSALMGRAGQTNYAASKAGILGLTRSLAREVARYGITVNAISPGVIETELTKGMDERLRSEFISMIPMGRFGRAEEVANAVSFLASDEAGYITGQYISVDGGLT